ncbi:hypothetical protein TomMM35A_32210 [Sphingobium sp. TomMM35A]
MPIGIATHPGRRNIPLSPLGVGQRHVTLAEVPSAAKAGEGTVTGDRRSPLPNLSPKGEREKVPLKARYF